MQLTQISHSYMLLFSTFASFIVNSTSSLDSQVCKQHTVHQAQVVKWVHQRTVLTVSSNCVCCVNVVLGSNNHMHYPKEGTQMCYKDTLLYWYLDMYKFRVRGPLKILCWGVSSPHVMVENFVFNWRTEKPSVKYVGIYKANFPVWVITWTFIWHCLE